MKDQCRVGMRLKLREQASLPFGRFCTSYTLLTGKRNSFVSNIPLYLLWGLSYGGIKVFTRIIRRRRPFRRFWRLPVSLTHNSASASLALLRERQLSIYSRKCTFKQIYKRSKRNTFANEGGNVTRYSPVYIQGNSHIHTRVHTGKFPSHVYIQNNLNAAPLICMASRIQIRVALVCFQSTWDSLLCSLSKRGWDW